MRTYSVLGVVLGLMLLTPVSLASDRKIDIQVMYQLDDGEPVSGEFSVTDGGSASILIPTSEDGEHYTYRFTSTAHHSEVGKVTKVLLKGKITQREGSEDVTVAIPIEMIASGEVARFNAGVRGGRLLSIFVTPTVIEPESLTASSEPEKSGSMSR